uniref:Iron-sulfur clusters transporter ABCB7, mitochondrial n=1 Tax=Oikopleura dioica TaxID=34765 RepID=Q66S09_OIKDI|nr:ABC transporter 7 [Oikopleura dioica]
MSLISCIPRCRVITIKRFHTHGAAVIGNIDGLDRADLTTAQLMKKVKPFIWPKSDVPEASRFSKYVNRLVFEDAKASYEFIAIEAGNIPSLENVAVISAPFAAYAAVSLLEPTVDQYKSYTFATVKQSTTRKIGRGLVEKLFSLDHRFHTNRETGALLKSDIDCSSCNLHCFYSSNVSTRLYWCIHLAFLWPTLCRISPSYRTPYRIAMNKADMDAGNLATDSLLNYETVKYFANEKYEATRYDGKLANFEQAALKTDRTLALLNMGQQAILGSCLLFNLGMASGILDFGQASIAAQTMSLGEFVMIASYFQQIQRPLSFLGSTYRDLVQARTDFETMWRLMEEQPELGEGTRTLSMDQDLEVRFNNVRFAYGDGNQILNGIDFSIRPGERVAIVGGSGSGKSTLAKLLFRFYDPQEGSVQVNGEDIRDYNLKSFRERIGVVPQDCVLFNDTIYNNIRYGNLNATEEQIIEAAKVADLHRSVEEMNFGYDTIVGERGVKLSGGEKQRLAIARCFLKDPEIVIYDEATSSLDSLTEQLSFQRILSSLDKATENKSLLVIAHRLSTIVNSDKIIVLKDGKVAEMGNHAELLALNNHYRKMWDIQSNEKDTSKKVSEVKNFCPYFLRPY